MNSIHSRKYNHFLLNHHSLSYQYMQNTFVGSSSPTHRHRKPNFWSSYLVIKKKMIIFTITRPMPYALSADLFKIGFGFCFVLMMTWRKKNCFIRPNAKKKHWTHFHSNYFQQYTYSKFGWMLHWIECKNDHHHHMNLLRVESRTAALWREKIFLDFVVKE